VNTVNTCVLDGVQHTQHTGQDKKRKTVNCEEKARRGAAHRTVINATKYKEHVTCEKLLR
jgi:hypothetical protein